MRPGVSGPTSFILTMTFLPTPSMIAAGAFSFGFLFSAVLSPFVGRVADARGPPDRHPDRRWACCWRRIIRPWPNAPYSLDGFFVLLNAFTPQAGEVPGKQRITLNAFHQGRAKAGVG